MSMFNMTPFAFMVVECDSKNMRSLKAWENSRDQWDSMNAFIKRVNYKWVRVTPNVVVFITNLMLKLSADVKNQFKFNAFFHRITICNVKQDSASLHPSNLLSQWWCKKKWTIWVELKFDRILSPYMEYVFCLMITSLKKLNKTPLPYYFGAYFIFDTCK